MTLAELTEPYERQMLENQRKELEILRWLAAHPNVHPDERKAQVEVCEQIEQQNARIGEQWDAARDGWMRAKEAR